MAITLTANPDTPLHFYFDFDINAGQIVEDVHLLSLVSAEEGLNAYSDYMSPDGSFVPVYHDARFADAGIVYGEVTLMTLETGETVNLEIPGIISLFQFQP